MTNSTNNRPRLLIIEDEPSIVSVLQSGLEDSFQIQVSVTGRDALKLLSRQPPEIVLLDLGLPDMDGKQLIQAIREISQLPVIILSARDQEQEKVAAFESGADDYVTKPVGMAELSARLRAALRRARGDGGKPIKTGDLVVNLASHQVILSGREIELTPTEYSLLACFVKKAGQVVTQSELLREVWGKGGEGNGHYLRIYVQHLRQKLKDDPLSPRYIFTEPGIGYRFLGSD